MWPLTSHLSEQPMGASPHIEDNTSIVHFAKFLLFYVIQLFRFCPASVLCLPSSPACDWEARDIGKRQKAREASALAISTPLMTLASYLSGTWIRSYCPCKSLQWPWVLADTSTVNNLALKWINLSSLSHMNSFHHLSS